MGRRTVNILGQRFGRLVVIGQAPTVRYSRWRCRCECGAEIVVSWQMLQMGAAGTRSCGCLRREQQSANMRRMHAEQRLPRYRTAENDDGGRTLAEVW